MIVDADAVSALIERVGAEIIAPRFGALRDSEIDTKSGPQDFVTVVDREAEAALRDGLTALLPNSSFVGEESAARDPATLDHLHGDDPVWIVDPLDGTRNFVQGREAFGTIVALAQGGETIAGWIYAVPEGRMLFAERGGGASWSGNAIRRGPDECLDPQTRPRGFRAIGNLADPWKRPMTTRLRADTDTEPAHCSVYVYIALARCEVDFAFYSRCQPWDHAAGILAVSEIGGRAAYLDDKSAYRPFPSEGRPLLIGADERAWGRVAGILSAEPVKGP